MKKISTLLALCVLGAGCRTLHCPDCDDSGCAGVSAATAQASDGVEPHDTAGADCQILIEPGGNAWVMEVEYESTVNPITTPVPPLVLELDTSTGGYDVGDVNMPPTTTEQLTLEVPDLNDHSTAKATMNNATVSAMKTASPIASKKPVVYPFAIDGVTKNFKLIASYRGVQFDIDCIYVP